jgi:hypothetical protein
MSSTINRFAPQSKANTQNTSLLAPFRGPSGYQSLSQYYDVLNRFFSAGVRVRRCARFKRIGDKRGWGTPEWIEGLEIDRTRFVFEWKLTQVTARLSELVLDGCEVVSYKKKDAPAGMVSYLLVSWPTNAELERNRAVRTAKKQSKQQSLPREITPFQHPNPRIGVERLGTTQPQPANDSKVHTWREFTPDYSRPKPGNDSPTLFDDLVMP